MSFHDPGPQVMARALADKLEEDFSDAMDEIAARFTCSCPDERHGTSEVTWREYIEALRAFAGDKNRADPNFTRIFLAQIGPVMRMAESLDQNPFEVLAMEDFRYEEPGDETGES